MQQDMTCGARRSSGNSGVYTFSLCLPETKPTLEVRSYTKDSYYQAKRREEKQARRDRLRYKSRNKGLTEYCQCLRCVELLQRRLPEPSTANIATTSGSEGATDSIERFSQDDAWLMDACMDSLPCHDESQHEQCRALPQDEQMLSSSATGLSNGVFASSSMDNEDVLAASGDDIRPANPITTASCATSAAKTDDGAKNTAQDTFAETMSFSTSGEATTHGDRLPTQSQFVNSNLTNTRSRILLRVRSTHGKAESRAKAPSDDRSELVPKESRAPRFRQERRRPKRSWQDGYDYTVTSKSRKRHTSCAT